MIKLASSIDKISARIDAVNNMIEYIGVGITHLPLQGKHENGETIIIPINSPVTYVLREYNEEKSSGPWTQLMLYFVKDNKSYHFTDSTSLAIKSAAHFWGLDDYR